MSAEQTFIELISALPGWQGPVTNGYQPQDDEKVPTALPFTIVGDTATEWLTTLCGTYPGRCWSVVAVTFVALEKADAKRMAQAARPVLIDAADSLENEEVDYDGTLGAWFARQSYRVFDVSPNV